MQPSKVALTFDGKTVSGSKAPITDGEIADFAIVLAKEGSELSRCLVDLSASGVTRQTLDSIDPTRGQAKLTFDGAPATRIGSAGDGWHIATQVMDRAAILIGFEQLGGADRALEMGRDYALERMAFGRQIGSFQAVKHILADMYVSATLARSNCYYGAWVLSSSAAELPIAAATARVSATNAFQHCAQEQHPGPWRHGLHLGVRLPPLSPPLQCTGPDHRLALHLGEPAHRTDERRKCRSGRLEGKEKDNGFQRYTARS